MLIQTIQYSKMTATLFAIEFWNPKTKKYYTGWTGRTEQWAKIMMDKPYNRPHTRRLLKITTEIVDQKKGYKR